MGVWCEHRYTLEANDHVTVMKVMLLRSQETMSGRKEYIVAGATLVCGEDTPSIGKVSMQNRYVHVPLVRTACTCK